MSEFTIFLQDVEINMYLGIHPEEKENLQRVFLNVKLCVNTGTSFYDVVDYDLLMSHLRLYNNRSILTQEQLVSEIMDFTVKTFPNLKEIIISSAKPDVFVDCDRVGVEVCKKIVD